MVDKDAAMPDNARETDAGHPPTFWKRLVRLLLPSPLARAERQAERLRELNVALRLYPESPTNYVLRGEFYLELGDYGRAADDFCKALGLACRQFDDDRWGIVAQSMQDRAQRGLKIAQRNLNLEDGVEQYDASGEV